VAALTHNLTLDIKKCFFDTNDEKDIDIAIALHRKSIEITPQTHEAYPLHMTHLAQAVLARYDNVSKTSADLDLAINLHHTILAVLLSPSLRWTTMSRPLTLITDIADPFKMLAVVQTKSLPNTLHELRVIQRHIPSDALVALGHLPSTPLAMVSEVLRHLSIFPPSTSLVTPSRIWEILWRAHYCWTTVENSVLSALCNTICVTRIWHFFACAKRRWGRGRYLMKVCIWVRHCCLPDSKV